MEWNLITNVNLRDESLTSDHDVQLLVDIPTTLQLPSSSYFSASIAYWLLLIVVVSGVVVVYVANGVVVNGIVVVVVDTHPLFVVPRLLES